MRKFDYLKDHSIISTIVKAYLKTLKKELILLQEYEQNIEYENALNELKLFEEKYPDLSEVSYQILEDLTSAYCINYFYEFKKYPSDASQMGKEFESDLKKIIILEEKLKELAIEKWKHLTKYEDIENGKDFMIVGHAAYLFPGLSSENQNDKNNIYRPQYISCSLFSQNELNTFQNLKIVYITDVNEDNYISSSYVDSVTSDLSDESFLTLKTINVDGKEHHIKVGYSMLKDEGVTTIMTPKIVEMLSLKREIEENKEMYSYEKSQTNEIVLDRTKTINNGILLISNGCDLLIREYIFLKEHNLEFKCINKGLYRRKNNQTEYTEKEYNDFLKELDKIDYMIIQNMISIDFLKNYYNDVVLNMNYSSEVLNIINNRFSKYIDLNTQKR